MTTPKEAPKNNRYAPLHVHDTYGSVGDSILTIDDYIDKAKKLGIKDLALTNHGSLSSFVSFYEKAQKEGLNPIIGCEVYFCDNRLIHEKENKETFHLILLAKNYVGLQNLIQIHNDAQDAGFYYKPRTDFTVLEKHREGLICLSACIAGPIAKSYLKADKDKTAQYVEKFSDLYGEDFYLEIQPGRFREQIAYNDFLSIIGSKLGIKLVATNDIHYLNKEDYRIHDFHVKESRKMDYGGKLVYPDVVYYLMSKEELINSFVNTRYLSRKNIRDAVENTNEVAAKCRIILKKIKCLPRYSEDIDEAQMLRELCFQALDKMDFTKTPYPRKDYRKRLDYELGVIDTLGFSGYFLIVKDFIDYCDKNDIARGPGRGSACGSIVSFLLNISIADPLKYGLMFERFLSVHRKSWPDIDIDIAGDQRQPLYQHIRDKYGASHCCFVSTMNMRKARAAVKAACRLLDIDIGVSNYVAKAIPRVSYDDEGEKHVDLTIREAYDSNPQFRMIADKYPDIICLADKLEGFPSNPGIHPAGVLISPVDINNIYPLVKCKNNDTLKATSLDLKDVEDLGGVKFDLLALSSLKVIHKTLKDAGIKFDYADDKLLNDPAVWKTIGSENTNGLFQISSSTYKRRMPLLKPKNILELANCLALVRGPCISSGADQKYIDILQGRSSPVKIHDVYWEATKDTYGILIYQEQVLKICMNIGFDSETAYKILKAVSKKKMEAIRSYHKDFLTLAKNKDIDSDIADTIWKEIETAGLYAFNIGHAVSYALLCYCSAWLKYHYPVEFICNLLTKEYEKSGTDMRIDDILDECYNKGILFEAPDINESEWEFVPTEDGHIRIGYCAVKGIGRNTYEHIKQCGHIRNFDDFVKRAAGTNVNKKSILILIAAGMFHDTDEASSFDLSNRYVLEIRKEKTWDHNVKIGTNQSFDLSKVTLEQRKKILFGSRYYEIC